MKFLLLTVLTVFSMNVFADSATKSVICSESYQKTPFLGVEYSTFDDGTHKVTVKEIQMNNSVSTKTYEGSEPKVSITQSTTSEGDNLVLINIIKDKVLRVLVCSAE